MALPEESKVAPALITYRWLQFLNADADPLVVVTVPVSVSPVRGDAAVADAAGAAKTATAAITGISANPLRRRVKR